MRLKRAAGLVLLASLSLCLTACSSTYGSQFLADKKSNVLLREFVTFSTIAGGTAPTFTNIPSGTPTPANGGPNGPLGGNPTVFQYAFDPFPNGASFILPKTVGSSIADVSSQNRTQVVNIAVTFTGHDVNNNFITIFSVLPASGQLDLSQISTGATAGTGTTVGGTQISVLRPSTVILTGTGGVGPTSGGVEQFFSEVAAVFSISNGISFTLDTITLQYFNPDGTVTPISAYHNVVNFFMQANPISTGFTSGAGAP